MSSEKTAPQDTARLVEGKFAIHSVADNDPSAAEKVEVNSLQIDESYDADADPYNCTGKFLVEALKQKHDD